MVGDSNVERIVAIVVHIEQLVVKISVQNLADGEQSVENNHIIILRRDVNRSLALKEPWLTMKV